MASSSPLQRLTARHIQNYTDAKTLEPHWGYVDRVLPCTSDAGSCAYLDVVYHAHDLGMLYVGIVWATIGGILFVWGLWRRSAADHGSTKPRPREPSNIRRLASAARVEARRWLLPDAPRWLFGRTSRLQVVLLSAIAGYLLIWSFLGYTYKTWITPVKASPGTYNTRTSLGPFADRVGVLAYGLLPLSIMLSSRESMLSLITGVPYHHFNFLHRWLGYIILLQSLLHTIGWTIVEARLYQPQPTTAREWISETYMIWGCVAMILLTLLWILTLPVVVRRTGYEFFRKAHYVLAIVFLGACWGHWAQLKCFLLPSMLLWGADRGARLVRTFLLHYNILDNEDGSTAMGFRSAQAGATLFRDAEEGDVVRLDIDAQQTQAWHVGQHYYLTFTECSVWQSHPLTPLSLPHVSVEGRCRHAYVFRAKGGETRKVARLLAAKEAADGAGTASTGVLFCGPYGQSIADAITPSNDNVLCVAGGTGITFVLPLLLHLAATTSTTTTDRRVTLLWIVRHARDAEWVRAELDALSRHSAIGIRILSTRDTEADPADADEDVSEKAVAVHADRRRPDVVQLVDAFITSTVAGPTKVVASGPGTMLSELRAAVAARNSGRKTMLGRQDGDVRLIADDRLEW